eukprot:4201138-Pyramimonas_sp.AAC.1
MRTGLRMEEGSLLGQGVGFQVAYADPSLMRWQGVKNSTRAVRRSVVHRRGRGLFIQKGTALKPSIMMFMENLALPRSHTDAHHIHAIGVAVAAVALKHREQRHAQVFRSLEGLWED